MIDTNLKIMKKNITTILLEKKLVEDESIAKSLIMAGKVIVNSRRVEKPSQTFEEDANIRIKFGGQFVSRAGDKIKGAVDLLELAGRFEGKVCLDVGSSTGGFTDYLLKSGAKKVYAVDVGTNQLDWRLRDDGRVTVYEKTDIRNLYQHLSPANNEFDWIVVDVSFISLLTISESINHFSSVKTNLLLMFKPQFEVPKNTIPKGGVIENKQIIDSSLSKIIQKFKNLGFSLMGQADSPLKGRRGNQEIFLFFKKKSYCIDDCHT